LFHLRDFNFLSSKRIVQTSNSLAMALNEKSTSLAQHAEQTAPVHNVTVEEATLIADAVEHANPSPWTLSMLRLYGCLLIGYLCATTNGFDGAVMGFVASVSITGLH
jgi:hypothetical protein